MSMETQVYVSAIVIVQYLCFLLISVGKNGKKHFFGSINIIILSYIIHSIAGFFSCLIDFRNTSIIGQYICSILYAVTGYFALFAYGRFFIKTCELPMKEKKIIKTLNLIVLILNIVVNFSLIPSGLFFSVTEDCVYVRGDLFFFSYLFVVIELLSISIYACIAMKNKRKAIGNMCFGLFPLLFSLLMLFFPIASTMVDVATVIAFLILYAFVYIEDREIALENETKLAKYKTDIMLSQIGPHFIYNTLSTISALCTIDPKMAQDLSADFTDYLRNNLNMAKTDRLSTFEEELNHTKKYIDIEKVRFGKKINVEFDIKKTEFMLPSLSLQPIVENAIKHGITKKVGGGTVKISAEKEDGYYIVTVSDDGVGFDAENLNIEDNHYGIKNTRDRLRILVNGDMEIQSTVGKGTVVKLFVAEKER